MDLLCSRKRFCLTFSTTKNYSLSFDLGAGPVRLQSRGTFIDFEFHTMTAMRVGNHAYLYIDNIEQASGQAPGADVSLETVPPVFFGGATKEALAQVRKVSPVKTGDAVHASVYSPPCRKCRTPSTAACAISSCSILLSVNRRTSTVWRRTASAQRRKASGSTVAAVTQSLMQTSR